MTKPLINRDLTLPSPVPALLFTQWKYFVRIKILKINRFTALSAEQ